MSRTAVFKVYGQKGAVELDMPTVYDLVEAGVIKYHSVSESPVQRQYNYISLDFEQEYTEADTE